MSCRLGRSVADQFSQLWNEVGFFQSILEILPERDLQFPACFLQSCKGVSAAPACFASDSAADFAPFHVVADSVFAQIIVQRDVRMPEHQEELGFVIVNPFEGIV